MKDEFLVKEYEETYKQLRFYDERQSNYIKYVMTISSTIATFLIGLYKVFENDLGVFLKFQALICGLVFTCIVIILLSMIKNRLYFSFCAKQLNAIRAFFIKHELKKFKSFNQMYLSTDFKAFKPFSTQLLMIYGIAFVSIVFFALMLLSLAKFNALYYGSISFIVFLVFLIEIFFSYFYLSCKNGKNADEAVH